MNVDKLVKLGKESLTTKESNIERKNILTEEEEKEIQQKQEE